MRTDSPDQQYELMDDLIRSVWEKGLSGEEVPQDTYDAFFLLLDTEKEVARRNEALREQKRKRQDAFRDSTEEVMKRCAEWLDRNARDVANVIAGGSKEWEVTFKSGDDGMFPTVTILVNRLVDDVVDMYSDIYG